MVLSAQRGQRPDRHVAAEVGAHQQRVGLHEGQRSDVRLVAQQGRQDPQLQVPRQEQLVFISKSYS